MKSVHLAWKSMIRTYLDGNESVISDAAATDPHQCGFGKWCYGDGLAQFGKSSTMNAIEKPHHDLHTTIKRIVDLNRAGTTLTSTLLLQVDRCSDEVAFNWRN